MKSRTNKKSRLKITVKNFSERNNESTLTSFEAADRLGVSFTAVNYWIDRGIIRGFKTPGGHRRILSSELDEFAERYGFKQNKNKKTKILIVDDDSAFRRALIRRLKATKLELSILEATDGFEAGSIITEQKPSLILLDLELPGIDGFEVMKRIRKISNKSEVIVISGYTEKSNKTLAKKLGALSFFGKPLNTELLISTILKCLNTPPQGISRRRGKNHE